MNQSNKLPDEYLLREKLLSIFPFSQVIFSNERQLKCVRLEAVIKPDEIKALLQKLEKI